MMEFIKNLNDLCFQINEYCTNNEYEKDEDYITAFGYLEQAELQFNNYLSEWKLLLSDIGNVINKYEIVDMSNPYIRTAKTLDSLFEIVYDIAEFVRIGDTISLANKKNELQQKINDLDGKEEYYLEVAERYGASHGKDPFERYKNVIFDAKAELSHLEYFLKPTKYPQYSEKIYGKPYYYYNDKIINKFNRHGLGMAYEFNNYADNSNNLVLKKAKLPQTFKVIYPEEEQIKDTNQTKEYDLTNAPANNLIFLLDVSNSMDTEDKLPVLKESIIFLLGLMRDYDYVTLISFSGNAQIILPATSAKNSDTIIKVIQNLKPYGSTNVYKGLELAYKSAETSYIEAGTNRIILSTDGFFTIDKKITKIVEKNANSVSLSVFYFDKYEKYYEQLKILTDLGNGNCTIINQKNIKSTIVNEAKGH